MDYQKLKEDLIEARKAGLEAAERNRGEDGGTANLDSVFIKLKGAREKRVLETLEAAGFYSSGKTSWIGTGYLLTPPGGGQGNRRARAMEAMKKCLKDLGYDVLGYYKMD